MCAPRCKSSCGDTICFYCYEPLVPNHFLHVLCNIVLALSLPACSTRSARACALHDNTESDTSAAARMCDCGVSSASCSMAQDSTTCGLRFVKICAYCCANVLRLWDWLGLSAGCGGEASAVAPAVLLLPLRAPPAPHLSSKRANSSAERHCDTPRSFMGGNSEDECTIHKRPNLSHCWPGNRNRLSPKHHMKAVSGGACRESSSCRFCAKTKRCLPKHMNSTEPFRAGWGRVLAESLRVTTLLRLK